MTNSKDVQKLREVDRYSASKDSKRGSYLSPANLEKIYHLPSNAVRHYRSMSAPEKVLFWTMLLSLPIAAYALAPADVKETAGKTVKKIGDDASKAVKKVKDSAASAAGYLDGTFNAPPVADFYIYTPITNMTSGEDIVFDAGGSRDDDGIVQYNWFFQKDGGKIQKETTKDSVLEKKLEPGSYIVALTVEDGKGATSPGKEQKFFISPKKPEPRKFTPDMEVFGSDEYKKLVYGELSKVDNSSKSVQVHGKPAGEYVRYYIDKLIEGDEYNASRGNVPPDRLYLPKTVISASNLVHAARHIEQADDGFLEQTVNEFVDTYGVKNVREDQRIKDKITYVIERDAVETQVAWEKETYELSDEEARQKLFSYMTSYEHWDPEQFAIDFPKK